MPRSTGRSNIVVADVDGTLLYWINGQFSGENKEMLANVRRAAQTHLTMLLTAAGPALVADDADALGAVAALLAARPGRVDIVQAPQRVLDMYPEDETDEVTLVVDGVEEPRAATEYTTAAERELFYEVPSDPRVKLVRSDV